MKKHEKLSQIIFFLFLLIALAAVFINPVSAETTISFTDLNFDLNQKVDIYDPLLPENESYIGEYNLTDTVHLNGSYFVVVFKPSASVWYDNPWNAFEWITGAGMPKVLAFAAFFLTIVGIVSVAFYIYGRR